MGAFERFVLRRAFAREVRQGWDHDKRITNLYAMISQAAAREFSEDNVPTRHAYLREWFEASLRNEWAQAVPTRTPQVPPPIREAKENDPTHTQGGET